LEIKDKNNSSEGSKKIGLFTWLDFVIIFIFCFFINDEKKQVNKK